MKRFVALSAPTPTLPALNDVAPNHAGEDLCRFTAPPGDRAEWFARQVRGTANFSTGGGDARDFLHGFLSYQIEHHLFPDLPPLQYQRLQPKVKALCEKFGVPYRQETVTERVKKLLAIAIGDARMNARGAMTRKERAP